MKENRKGARKMPEYTEKQKEQRRKEVVVKELDKIERKRAKEN